MLTTALDVNWTHLTPQFEEMMQHSQYSLPEIRECLSYANSWTETLPFDGETFWYGRSSFTLTQLSNTVEMLVGDDRQFVEELRQKVIVVADKLLKEYNEELAMIDAQQTLEAELREVIEKEEAA